jgi:hypothetical protein
MWYQSQLNMPNKANRKPRKPENNKTIKPIGPHLVSSRLMDGMYVVSVAAEHAE